LLITLTKLQNASKMRIEKGATAERVQVYMV
jgi:hypothetical protein